MSWKVVPAVASGPVVLGAGRAEVRERLGPPSRAVDGEQPGDDYDGVHVTYDAGGRCVVVEAWGEVQPVLDGAPVLSLPYIEVVRRLRAAEPGLVVDGGGALSLERGVGLGAPDGVDEPFGPARTVIVFVPGVYDEVLATRRLPPRVAVQGLSFSQLLRRLEAGGWTADVIDRRPPLVAGEPELARFERGADRMLCPFDPVAGVRWLELDRCRPPTAREVWRAVPQWAAVDASAALADSEDVDQVLWGLRLAEVLADRSLEPAVARHRTHVRPVIAAAAERVLVALDDRGRAAGGPS